MQNQELIPASFIDDIDFNPGEDLNDFLDRVQGKMASMPQSECPVSHRFTYHQYIREIFMPAGLWIISKIHLTEHPFFILSGKVTVFDQEGRHDMEGPFLGITKPGTRRLLYIHESTIWATYHLTAHPEETLDEIEERIIQKRDINLSLEHTKSEFECLEQNT